MSEFSLTVPDPAQIQQEILPTPPPAPEDQAKIKEQADKNATAIMECENPDSEQSKTILAMMESFGMGNLVQVGTANNALMKTSLSELAKAGEGGDQVSKTLVSLQKEIKELDPSGVDFSRKGFLSIFSNPIKKYFSRYQKSENVIGSIVDSLENGKQTLIKDNGSLKNEQTSLRENTKKLKTDIELGSMMDKAIEDKLAEARASGGDPDKLGFIEKEILFPLRQRIMDMQQLQVVSQQGFLAMEVIQRNNNELIRGVDRAKNVTVAALRIAVTVASSLYNQKITLEKIKALNETTGGLIAQTSKMLKEQGAEIQKQAMSSSISVDTLKQSFQDIMGALDDIDRYKAAALPVMKSTIDQFQKLAQDGEQRIQKLEKGARLTQGQGAGPQQNLPPA
ncbi:MAG: toxic anion resistance protein [Deltaproteobacteria bacterium]|jgi:uncharacterized protein YaaN involved in tellurite resistance|nr:toxic anion resistance protein [Deltaproteobacteria bacterium]